MCTVTYIPDNNKQFTLTSNRDERIYRPTLPPRVYDQEKNRICFPRDTKAGGTWIAMNDWGRIGCLLNGAFEAHTKEDYHTHSRGQVLLGLMKTPETPDIHLQGYDLSRTEPFSIITLDTRKGMPETISESIWDGNKLHFRVLRTDHPYMWSSVTLYDKKTRETRKSWFDRFLASHREQITREDIFDFHSGTHTRDMANNLVMKRDDGLKTVSITQIWPEDGKIIMKYLDLEQNTVFHVGL